MQLELSAVAGVLTLVNTALAAPPGRSMAGTRAFLSEVKAAVGVQASRTSIADRADAKAVASRRPEVSSAEATASATSGPEHVCAQSATPAP